ncbi:ABC transporter ATP-binding protein [Qipengyuania sediminis]|uniref:ABC transporter ATP-binding protein n=1 Tax=Qipengyuania sediminis TaxID=1532023 RepID=UPI00105A1F58|nr:ABC transporter ATP-binding protein [Qipengyuania sediminis]
MNALAVQGLTIGRGEFSAGPFAFDLPEGVVLALVGANGSGKSTLLRTLAGLTPPRSGRIVRGEGAAALLPPPGTLTAPFTAEHMVTLGRAGHHRLRAVFTRNDRAAAMAALESLGIADLAPRSFDRLSSGQQQLVLLARLIAQEASLCLLDEPTATLDPVQAAKVERCITALAQAGRTVVIATHSLGFARTADQVLTLGAGFVFGPPEAVLTAERTAALYGAELPLCTACGQPSAAITRA